MNIYKNGKISARQAQALIIMDIFGLSAIAFPRFAAQTSGKGFVLSIAAATALTCVLCPVYAYLGKDKNGLLNLKLIRILYAIKLIAVNVTALKFFTETVRYTALYQTSEFITAALVVLCALFCALNGIEGVARTAELLFALVFVPLLLAFIATAFSVKVSPYFEISVLPSKPSGFLPLLLCFQNAELMAFADVRGEKIGLKGAAAIIFTGVVFIAVTLAADLKFGFEGLLRKPYPFIQLLDTLDFPGAFIERQDAIVIWIVSAFIFCAVVSAIYFSADIAYAKKSKSKVCVSAAIFFLAYVLNANDGFKRIFGFIAVWGGFAFTFILPCVFFVIKRFGKGGGV